MKLSLDPYVTAPRNTTAESLALPRWYDSQPAVRRLWGIRSREGKHSVYDALVNKVMRFITDAKQMEAYSTPEQIAEVVYEAATDERAVIVTGHPLSLCSPSTLGRGFVSAK